MATADRLTVYADYASPFCFFGHLALTKYCEMRDGPLTVEWHPFDLRANHRDPNGSRAPDTIPAIDEPGNADVQERVARLAKEYGVELAQLVASDIDSRNAQLASTHVQMTHPDDWPEFDSAVYDALWRDGVDIGDPAVLASIATEIGLDGEEIRSAIADPLVERRLDDRFEAARLRGIEVVPTFVHGEETVRGVVSPERLTQIINGSSSE